MRGTRISREQRMQIVEIFAQEERGERVIGQKSVAGPVANQTGERTQVVIKAARKRRHEKIGIFYNATHLDGGLVQTGEIRAITEIARERFNCGSRRTPVFLAFFEMRPLGEGLAALFDAYAVPRIEA